MYKFLRNVNFMFLFGQLAICKIFILDVCSANWVWTANFDTFNRWKQVLLAVATEVVSKVVATLFKANYDFNSVPVKFLVLTLMFVPELKSPCECNNGSVSLFKATLQWLAS